MNSYQSISLKVEPDPGSQINNVCNETIDLAKKLGLTVDFTFNGIHCMAQPEGTADKLVKNYWAASESNRPYKFANSIS